jgi:selenophosphate synthase
LKAHHIIYNERTEMSSQDRSSDMAQQESIPQSTDRDNDGVASKLSKELNNWRRRRTNGRPKRDEGERVNYQTESARTIKLRGHETLVVRKPKLAKPTASQRPNN